MSIAIQSQLSGIHHYIIHLISNIICSFILYRSGYYPLLLVAIRTPSGINTIVCLNMIELYILDLISTSNYRSHRDIVNKHTTAGIFLFRLYHHIYGTAHRNGEVVFVISITLSFYRIVIYIMVYGIDERSTL